MNKFLFRLLVPLRRAFKEMGGRSKKAKGNGQWSWTLPPLPIEHDGQEKNAN